MVTAVTNAMLVADQLFPFRKWRSDEEDGENANLYSDILGCHEMRLTPEAKANFTKEFNNLVDNIRADRRDGGENADMLNKDKTRMLQLIPPIDVLEKVVRYLLVKRDRQQIPTRR